MTINLRPASTHTQASSRAAAALLQHHTGVPPAVGAQHANKEDLGPFKIAVLARSLRQP